MKAKQEMENAVPKKPPKTDNKMAIIPSDYPKVKLTEAEHEYIVEAITKKVLEECTLNKQGPQFEGHEFEDGAVIITCANPFTKKWLESSLHQFLPWLSSDNNEDSDDDMIKVFTCLPESLKDTSTDDVLRFLKFQNPGLATNKWSILNRRVLDYYQALTIDIDKESYKVLEKTNFKVFIGLGTIHITVLSDSVRQKSLEVRPSTDIK